jgi:hypothetical protein
MIVLAVIAAEKGMSDWPMIFEKPEKEAPLVQSQNRLLGVRNGATASLEPSLVWH